MPAMNEAMEMLSGSTYTYLRLLGRGGMGHVHLAYHEPLKRYVAIKFLENSANISYARFQLEASSLAQLNHPNVVQIYDYLHAGTSQAIVMEYVEGTTLRRFLRENVVDLTQKLRWLINIADGLSAAHDKGFIHRDLKEDNILIDQKHQAKITDFGVVKYLDPSAVQETMTGDIVGTISVLSPEQALGKTLDQKSDLFSFGILAYRMLFRKHPFGEAIPPFALVHNIINQSPAPFPVDAEGMPPALLALVAQLLQKRPADRPDSAMVVATVLKKILIHCADRQSQGTFEAVTAIMPMAGALPRVSDNELTVINPSTLSNGQGQSRKYRIALLFAGFMLVVLAGLMAYRYLPKSDSIAYVAILKPLIEGDLSENESRLLVEAIDLALQENTIGSSQLQLISPSQVRSTTGDYTALAKVHGVDVFVEAALSCKTRRCLIALRKISDSSAGVWSVQELQKWEFLADAQYLNVAHDVRAHFYKLFPRIKENLSEADQLSKLEYEWFIERRFEVLTKKTRLQENWLELLDADSAFYHYQPYFDLLRYLAFELYDNSKSVAILDELQRINTLAKGDVYMSEATLITKIDIALRRQNVAEAKAALAELKATNTNQSAIATFEGMIAQSENDYELAGVYFDQAYALHPNASALYDVALNYWLQGNLQKARSILEQAIAGSPHYRQPRNLLASLYLFEERYDQAIAEYQLLAENYPVAQHFNNLGLAYEFKGNYVLANQAIQRAVDLTPDNPIHLLNLADSFGLMGDTETAVQRYRQVVAMTETSLNDWEYLIAYTQSQAHLGDARKAFESLHKLLASQSEIPEVLYTAALIYSLTEQFAVSGSYIAKSLASGIPVSWFRLPWFAETLKQNPDVLVSSGR